jgi:hypothetical protein
MAGRQAGFWDVEHRLRQLSERGDPLEKLAAAVWRWQAVRSHGISFGNRRPAEGAESRR